MPDANTNYVGAPASAAFRPDTRRAFRMAQLLLAVEAAHELGHLLDLERLAVTDFLAASPFLVVGTEDDAATKLALAGFSPIPLTYAAPGQRFATRRSRLLGDVASMASLGLVAIEAREGRRIVTVTKLGLEAASQLTSTYADAFRVSLRLISPRVNKLSDTALRKQLERWLRADPLLFDLIEIEPQSGFEAPADPFELIG